MSQEYDNKKSSDISNFSRDQQNISVEEYQLEIRNIVNAIKDILENGSSSDIVFLKNLLEEKINPATEEKQETIIEKLDIIINDQSVATEALAKDSTLASVDQNTNDTKFFVESIDSKQDDVIDKLSNLNGLIDFVYDSGEIQRPDSVTENYIFKLGDTVVGTIQLVYTDSTKENLLSFQKIYV